MADAPQPAHLIGKFVSRTNWALVLIGVILAIGGIAATIAIVYDMSTGRTTFGDVMHDIGVFIEGWVAELIAGAVYDAELEKTRAYALCILLLPGLLLVWYLIQFFKRGTEFRIEHDGSVAVRSGATRPALLEFEYSVVTADGTTIAFSRRGKERGRWLFPSSGVLWRVRRSAALGDQRGVLPPSPQRPWVRPRRNLRLKRRSLHRAAEAVAARRSRYGATARWMGATAVQMMRASTGRR